MFTTIVRREWRADGGRLTSAHDSIVGLKGAGLARRSLPSVSTLVRAFENTTPRDDAVLAEVTHGKTIKQARNSETGNETVYQALQRQPQDRHAQDRLAQDRHAHGRHAQDWHAQDRHAQDRRS
jgi:YD repeat-containing protein